MRRSLVQCTSCRKTVLEAFTSIAGISISPRADRPRFSTIRPPTARPFGILRSLQQSLQTSETASDPSPSASSPQLDADVPWYLKVEAPLPPSPILPLLALQEIPPLPPNPPALLSPVLTHLSTQIGLDNLTILDLRNLDPPAALGSNLIMILGTARSVKHLNVSADRFCRWARKEFKLRPYADGLLGRNELKLKLRRKARRMKLAQSVGNTVANGADDGITTGWICVNMGNVDEAVLAGEGEDHDGDDQDHAAPSTEPTADTSEKLRFKAQETPAEGEEEYRNPSDEDYVGFGSKINAPRIVVQMFIEEKRVEMDLEGLWHHRQSRRAKKGEKADAQAAAAVKMMEQEHELDGPFEKAEDLDSEYTAHLRGREGSEVISPEQEAAHLK
jgi:hypothetical protein